MCYLSKILRKVLEGENDELAGGRHAATLTNVIA
jgi:hypothetical protein